MWITRGRKKFPIGVSRWPIRRIGSASMCPRPLRRVAASACLHGVEGRRRCGRLICMACISRIERGWSAGCTGGRRTGIGPSAPAAEPPGSGAVPRGLIADPSESAAESLGPVAEAFGSCERSPGFGEGRPGRPQGHPDPVRAYPDRPRSRLRRSRGASRQVRGGSCRPAKAVAKVFRCAANLRAYPPRRAVRRECPHVGPSHGRVAGRTPMAGHGVLSPWTAA